MQGRVDETRPLLFPRVYRRTLAMRRKIQSPTKTHLSKITHTPPREKKSKLINMHTHTRKQYLEIFPKAVLDQRW